MNSRLKELKKLASRDVLSEDQFGEETTKTVLDIEKFAKLILKDCIVVCEKLDGKPAWLASKHIQERFSDNY